MEMNTAAPSIVKRTVKPRRAMSATSTFEYIPRMDTLRADVRYALASIRRNTGFAVAGLLTLALGIGATTAVFSVVYGVLMRPLPYPDADRLVQLSEEHPGG